MKDLVSIPAIAVYLLIASFTFFSMMLNTFFVADDFTWLHWVADCGKSFSSTGSCVSVPITVLNFFMHSENFFYRPAMKIYFYIMYSFAGFDPVGYHVTSLLVHWINTLLVFLLALRILKNKMSAFLVAVLFLLLSAHAETILWISSIGHLFVALFTLLAVYFFDIYKQKRRWYYFFLTGLSCLIAPLFHESGIIAGVLVLAYSWVFYWRETKRTTATVIKSLLLLLPVPIYLALRTVAHSIWGTGDYSYNLLKLPFNFVGNLLGYFLVCLIGLSFTSTYDTFREYGRTHVGVVILLIVIWIVVFAGIFYLLQKKFSDQDKKIGLTSLIFFVIPLLPFLPLGNMTARYSYLASFGVCLFLIYFVERLATIVITKHAYKKYIIAGILIIFTICFGWYHYAQLVRANADWVKAGNITRDLLQDLSDEFAPQDSLPKKPVFYFSNVPTTYGQAWVFQTGLSDAIWMTFQDKNIKVVQTPSLQESFKEADGSAKARLYEFDKNYNVTETLRTEIPVTQPNHAK